MKNKSLIFKVRWNRIKFKHEIEFQVFKTFQRMMKSQKEVNKTLNNKLLSRMNNEIDNTLINLSRLINHKMYIIFLCRCHLLKNNLKSLIMKKEKAKVIQ